MIPRPLFKYPGSKWLLSRHYPEPRHDVLVEPFAGSACYSIRYHERKVILVEKDDEIAALWWYLIHADGNEIAKLPAKELEVGQDIRELPISYGAALLIRQWQRVGTSSCWTVSKWCNLPGQWNESTRDHVAASVEKIRHWTLIHGSAEPLSAIEATWFIDPPYQGLTLFGSKTIDFAGLATWCRSRRGQVIVCEQAKATWLPFRPFRSIVTGRRGQACSKGDSREGIWLSDFERQAAA